MDYNKLISEMLIKDNFTNSFIGKAFSDDVISDEDQKLIDRSDNSNKITDFFSSIGNMVSSTFNFKRYGGKVYQYEMASEGKTITDITEDIKNLLEARVLIADDEVQTISYLGKAIAYGMDNFSEEDIDIIIRNTALDVEKDINESIVITEVEDVIDNEDTTDNEELENDSEIPIDDTDDYTDDETVEDEETIEVEKDGDIDLILSIDEDLTLSEYEIGKMFMVEIKLSFTKNTFDTWKFVVFIANNKIFLWKIDTLLKSDVKRFYTDMLDLVTFIINENWSEFQSQFSSKLLDIINLSLTSQPLKYIKEPIVKFVNNTINDDASLKKANMNYIILSSCVVNGKVNEIGDSYLISTINGVLKSVIKKTSEGEYELIEEKLNSETLKKFMFACLKVDNTKKTLIYKNENATTELEEKEPIESIYLKNRSTTNKLSLEQMLNEVSTVGLDTLIDNVYFDELAKIFEYKIENEKKYKSERKRAYLKLISLLQNDMDDYVDLSNRVKDSLDVDKDEYEYMFDGIEYNVDDALEALTIIANNEINKEFTSYIEDEYIGSVEVEESQYIPEDTLITIEELIKLPKEKTFFELAEDNQYIDGFISEYEDNFGTDVENTYRKATNILFKKLLFELYDNEDNVDFVGYKMNDKVRSAVEKYDEYDNIYGNRIVSGELEGNPIIYNADEIVDAMNILKTNSKSNELKSLIKEVV